MGDKWGPHIGQPESAPDIWCQHPGQSFSTDKPLSIYHRWTPSVELYSEGDNYLWGTTRTPTESELSQLPRLILTSPHYWDPTTSASHLAMVSHLTAYQIESNHSILCSGHITATHNFMTPSWWHHS